jgi:hypothetical protein
VPEADDVWLARLPCGAGMPDGRWPYGARRIAIRKASAAIQRREFVPRDRSIDSWESALAVYATMAGDRITSTRGASGRIQAARAFPACGIGQRASACPRRRSSALQPDGVKNNVDVIYSELK